MTESPYVNSLLDNRELKRARTDLIRFLNRLYPNAVPAGVEETINQQPSLPLMNEWMDQALALNSLEEFIAYLRR